MGLREKWKRWTRPNYRLSIGELKNKRKKNTILSIIFEVISIFMMLFLLLFTLDLCELIVTIKPGVALIIILIISAIVMNVLLFLFLKFHIDALDFARDRDHINLLIYLKQQEKYGK